MANRRPNESFEEAVRDTGLKLSMLNEHGVRQRMHHGYAAPIHWDEETSALRWSALGAMPDPERMEWRKLALFYHRHLAGRPVGEVFRRVEKLLGVNDAAATSAN
jgi:hypothetical protein